MNIFVYLILIILLSSFITGVLIVVRIWNKWNINNKLIEAIESGQEKTVESLINKGASVNAIQRGTALTALMVAAKRGNINICKLLVHNGANVNMKDASRFTALSYAVEFHNQEVCDYLFSKDDISQLLTALTKPKPEARVSALKALTNIDPNWLKRPEVKNRITDFMTALLSTDQELRDISLTVLNSIDKRWRDSDPGSILVSKLIARLLGENQELRDISFTLLNSIDERWRDSDPASGLVSKLISRLLGENQVLQLSALEVLIKIVPNWNQNNDDVRKAVLYSLYHMDIHLLNNNVVDKLFVKLYELFKGPRNDLQCAAWEIMNKIYVDWPNRIETREIPDLVLAFRRSSKDAQRAVLMVLNKVDSDWVNRPELQSQLQEIKDSLYRLRTYYPEDVSQTLSKIPRSHCFSSGNILPGDPG